MKTIIYLNRFILATTCLLYLTIFLGLYAQIVLGGFQVLCATVILFFLSKLTKRQRNNIIIYWLLILIYGLVWYFEITGDSFLLIKVMLIPMSLAVYFTTILESLKKQK